MENPTSDEKILAALSHAAVIFPMLGPVVPAGIWAFQRQKSKYVRFHAMQAMGYQTYGLWLWFVGMFLSIFLLMIAVIPLEIALSDNPDTLAMSPLIIQPVFFLIILGSWGLFFLGGAIGAVFCLLNREFRYPIIGNWLKQKLFHDQVTDAEFEKWEENWISGVCHATVILRFWGIITPFMLWILEREHSVKIRFQALQAALYQLLYVVTAIASTAIGVVFYVLFIIVMAIGLNGTSPAANDEIPAWLGAVLIGVMVILILYAIATFIIMPVYYLMALIGSFRVASGHEFYYPILGDIIARRMKPMQVEVEPQP